MLVIREESGVWFWPTPPSTFHGSHRTSTSCLTTPWLPNQYCLAPCSTKDISTSLHHCSPLFSTTFGSSAFSLHSRSHLNQDARVSASEESGWKCDNNTRKKKLRKGRKKEGRLKEDNSLDLWMGCLDNLQGPHSCVQMSITYRQWGEVECVFNKGQGKHGEEEERVCVSSREGLSH